MIKLFNLSLSVQVFVAFFLPLGAFPLLKFILFLNSIILFLLIVVTYRHKLGYGSSLALQLFINYLFLTVSISIIKGFYGLEIWTELKSFLIILSVLAIFILGAKYRIVNEFKLLKIGIYSHTLYVLVKLLIFLLVYIGMIDIYMLKSISRDFVVAFFGKIPRITINNDLFSFVFASLLLINKQIIEASTTRKIVMALFLLNILISFNRISFISLLIFTMLYIVLCLRFTKFKEIFKLSFSLILLSLVLVIINSYFYDLTIIKGIVDTIFIRFGDEGKLSISEKMLQYKLFIEESSIFSFLFGHGMGTFLPSHIRYHVEGFRYGYEAFIGVLFYQFGIVGLAYILFMIAIPFYSRYIFKSKKLFMHAVIYILWILHASVNPVVLTFNSALIMGLIVLSYKHTYKYLTKC